MKHIVRGLAKSPLFTLTALVSLALGIGANTAMFSLLDQVLLRTLAVERPEELTFLYHPGPTQGSNWSDEADQPAFSYPVFLEFEKQQQVFTGIAGARNFPASLSYQNQALLGSAHLVTGRYFEVLGVRPALGRLLTAEDDRTASGHPVVVLNHVYWTSRFGANPAVLNQTMTVNGFPMTIVGVAQKGFAGEKFGGVIDVFIPVAMRREISPGWDEFSNRKNYWLPIFGRLKPGVTLERAEAAMNVLYRAQLAEDVKLLERPSPDFLARFQAKKLIAKPGKYGRGGIRQEGRTPLAMMMGMTLLVLLIACANVANLLLARAASRTRETAVRLAMGASRMQLVRQLLGESCVLSVAGGALGLGVAYATIRGILGFLPTWTGTTGFLSPTLDWRVLSYALLLSLATGVAFGLFPALQASKANVSLSLKDQAGQTTSTGAANLFRKALVTAQVAVSLLLLVSAGLFAKSLLNLGRLDLGIRADNLMTFSINAMLNRYTDERAAQFYHQLQTRLETLPGVTTVSRARVPVIASSASSNSIAVEGFTPQGGNSASAHYNQVGPGFFRTVGTPMIAGREFTDADNISAPKVAIVNEAFAKHFFAGRNPIGMHIGSARPDIEVVGVVKDAKYSDLREELMRVFYVPNLQSKRQGDIHFYVRTAMDPEQTVPMIRRELAALDPNMPLRGMKTMRAQLDENVFVERLLSTLTSIFGGLATLLAALGLYGVLAFNVARRTREIGIRMALGADSGRVRWLVLGEMSVMLAIGSAIGLAAAMGAGRFIRSVLFGVEPSDPVVAFGSAALLTAVALAAAFVPVRRATAVDPMVALRHE